MVPLELQLSCTSRNDKNDSVIYVVCRSDDQICSATSLTYVVIFEFSAI